MSLNMPAPAVSGRYGAGYSLTPLDQGFGEAHMIAVGAKGDIWVADTVNSTVHKFVRK